MLNTGDYSWKQVGRDTVIGALSGGAGGFTAATLGGAAMQAAATGQLTWRASLRLVASDALGEMLGDAAAQGIEGGRFDWQRTLSAGASGAAIRGGILGKAYNAKAAFRAAVHAEMKSGGLSLRDAIHKIRPASRTLRDDPTPHIRNGPKGLTKVDAADVENTIRPATVEARERITVRESLDLQDARRAIDDSIHELMHNGAARAGVVERPLSLLELRNEAAAVLGKGVRYKSTAVGAYEDGSLGVASSDTLVPRVQREWAFQRGVRVVNGEGHAEVTLKNGATLQTGPLKRCEVDSPHGRGQANPNGQMCSDCASETAASGAFTPATSSGVPSRKREPK